MIILSKEEIENPSSARLALHELERAWKEDRFFEELQDVDKQFDFHPMFWFAAQDGKHSLCRLLLNLGLADADTRCHQEGTSVLHMAIDSITDSSDSEGTSLVRLLLEKGANPNSGWDDNGRTPLYLAVKKRLVEVVRLLLEKGANVDDKMKEYRYGHTPLFCCIESVEICISDQEFPICQLLIKHGANVNEPCGRNKSTPLYMACIKGNPRIVSFLLEHGGNPLTECDGRLFKETPLHAAFRTNGDPGIILHLLTNVDSTTALRAACMYRSREGIIKLLKAGDVDINARDNMGYTPLHRALDFRRSPRFHAKRNQRESIRRMSIHPGQYDTESNVAAVELLLEHGASPNIPMSNYGPLVPLELALRNANRLELVSLLLRYGADPNHPNFVRNLPNLAKHEFYHPTLRVLLHHGADPTAIDYWGKTALEYACEGNPREGLHLGIIFELLQALLGVGQFPPKLQVNNERATAHS